MVKRGCRVVRRVVKGVVTGVVRGWFGVVQSGEGWLFQVGSGQGVAEVQLPWIESFGDSHSPGVVAPRSRGLCA